MDDARFDAWTRRRFGRATGGLVASLLPLTHAPDTTAGRRHRHPRCKASETRCGKTCLPGTCCPGTACGEVNCACGRTIDGTGFCASTRILPVCAQCETHTDCANPAWRCVHISPEECGSAAITASCKVPCGFTG
ncbi:MAG: hypothetical protein U0031_15025 [Thermomicrobiales bacterium]